MAAASKLICSFVLAIAALALTGPAAGATEKPYPYPFPQFDFATAHGKDFSPAGGARTIPLLVVHGTFTGINEQPGVSAATIAGDIFGPTGSIARYFDTVSRGKLKLVPAQETSGTANDGVVEASLGNNATFESLGGTPPDFTKQGRAVVTAADGSVDYSKFDANGDGKITSGELAILSIKTSTTTAENCGVTAGISSGDALDGKDLSANAWADVVTLTGQMTIAHELVHLLLGQTKDNSYVSGSLDILGVTCGAAKTDFWYPNAYNRLHWGWTKPTIVERDGYYDIAPGGLDSAYLLYDPEKGTNDYALVENRQGGVGGFDTFDAQASDTGLAIWGVDDSRWGTARGAFELIRPASTGVIDACGNAVNAALQTPSNYCGSSADAWDPLDPQTATARTMTGNWMDGTPAKVAVRAIHNQGSGRYRAYFDVRGAGVMVDTYQLTPTALVGETTDIEFPVMNTGEQTDTFRFHFPDGSLPSKFLGTTLPAGFSQSDDVLTLAPGESATAHVKLHIAPDTPAGTYQQPVEGISTTDTELDNPDGSHEFRFASHSNDRIEIKVEKRPTTLAYTGVARADYSDAAAVSATLTDTTSGSPVAGEQVTFRIGTQTASFTTDASGVAAGEIVLDQPAANTRVEMAFGGDPTYKARVAAAPFEIDRETLSLTYTGSTLVHVGATPTLSAFGTEQADGHAGDRSRAQVRFALAPLLTAAPFSFGADMTSAGTAGVLAAGLPADLWSVTATVPDENGYWKSAPTAPVELVIADPSALYTGDAAGLDSAGRSIATTFTAQYDNNRPKGAMKLSFSGGAFSGSSLDWIVQVGNTAILQIRGKLNGVPRTLRMRAVDSGQPGRADTFQVRIGDYDSGTVQVTAGNVRSH